MRFEIKNTYFPGIQDMVGMKPRQEEDNLIFFELEIDSLVRILPGGHCYLKLKLSKSQVSLMEFH